MAKYLREFDSDRDKKRSLKGLTPEQKLEAFQEMVDACEHIVFLGGAGVSTESGIPDFRSKNGLYRKTDKRFKGYKPEYLLSEACLSRDTDLFFDYYRSKLDARRVEPNEAHRKLAEMEQKGKLDAVITQNIDGLHQKAGSRRVLEIHGTTLKNHCVVCGAAYGPDFVFDSPQRIPSCPACKHMVRPDVTLYGELLPEEAYAQSVEVLRAAQLLIVGGTSLQVGSAAGLVHSFHGGYLVIINKGKCQMEKMADLVFHESIGRILQSLCV